MTEKSESVKEKSFALVDAAGIALGSFIMALGFNLFLIPNRIAAGGAGGLATVVYHLYGLPVGAITLLINVPLFAVACRSFGVHYMLRSLLGTFLLSFFIDLQSLFLVFSAWSSDPLLGAVYGGVLVGMGLSLVFRFRGTTGGSELAAMLLTQKSQLSSGMLLFLVDAAVIVLAGWVFDVELALYALISVYITSRLIDLLQEGFANSKALLIISDKYQELAALLPARLERGMTALASRGVYSGASRDALLIVVRVSQLPEAKRLVHLIDPDAFVVVSNAAEVLGEGFQRLRR